MHLAPPETRGMTIEFWAGDQHFRENFATHIYPFLDRVIGAVRVLKSGFVDEKIILFLGAPECELCIQAEQGSLDAALWVDLWPNSRRSKFYRPRELFSFRGKRIEIVVPFVKALKGLRESVSDLDFTREYGSPFPAREYSELISAVG